MAVYLPPGFEVGPDGKIVPTLRPGTNITSTNPFTGGAPPPPSTGGPDIIPPTNRTIPSGKQVGAWTNPFTEAHINPTTGQPEMLTGPGGIADQNQNRFRNPMSWLTMGANLYPALRLPVLATAATMASTPTASNDTISPEQAGARPEYPHTPTPPNAAPAYDPTADPNPGPAPNPYGAGMPRGGVSAQPAPAGAFPPLSQTSNLGYGAPGPGQRVAPQVQSPFTMIDRPNMSPQNSAQGRQGAPQMSALDLSQLFQHPAVQQAVARSTPNGAMHPNVLARLGELMGTGSST